MMIGVTINVTSLVYVDNMIVIDTYSLPSNSLNKNHNYIAYQKLVELVAAGVLCQYHVSIRINISDLLTKPLFTINHYPLISKLIFLIFK